MSNFLLELANTIKSRKEESIEKSYTALLLSKGFSECLSRFQEESKEFSDFLYFKKSKGILRILYFKESKGFLRK